LDRWRQRVAQRRNISAAAAAPSITFAWSAETLPHLQLWHDLRPGRCVLGVEPCTSPRLTGGRSGQEPILEPGEVRRYEIRISVDERR
jgi:galactose mutarotase-like enzyme